MSQPLWPPPNPRPYYFPVPNEVFRQEISSGEFAILAFLLSRKERKLDPPTLTTVRKNLCLSRNTLKKYVYRLQRREWTVVQHHRFSFPLVLSVRDTLHLTNTLKPHVGHFFPMPNCIFGFGLSVGELAVYGYLLYREDRKTYECWPSYRTIGAALHMSKNTVRKYVHLLSPWYYITEFGALQVLSKGKRDITDSHGNAHFTACFKNCTAINKETAKPLWNQ